MLPQDGMLNMLTGCMLSGTFKKSRNNIQGAEKVFAPIMGMSKKLPI
mgnify:CR=1 FL=1